MVEMAKAHSLNIEDYLVFLLNARANKDMSDAELEYLTGVCMCSSIPN